MRWSILCHAAGLPTCALATPRTSWPDAGTIRERSKARGLQAERIKQGSRKMRGVLLHITCARRLLVHNVHTGKNTQNTRKTVNSAILSAAAGRSTASVPGSLQGPRPRHPPGPARQLAVTSNMHDSARCLAMASNKCGPSSPRSYEAGLHRAAPALSTSTSTLTTLESLGVTSRPTFT